MTAFFLFFLYSNLACALQTSAKQALLIDEVTGQELLIKNADVKMTPSSMSKLMTIYILFDQLKNTDLTLDSKFLVSKKAWKKGGSKMFVANGTSVRIEDLIRGIIVQSGNDACITVAEGISGTESSFASLMNDYAKKLGLKNSNFVNATGWPDEGHEMSPRDILTLSQSLLRDFPEYYHYFSEKEFTYSGIKQYNRNQLLGKGLGIDGFKTGHTEAGGYGIVVSGTKEGRRVWLVINGLESNQTRIQEATRLIRSVYQAYKRVKLFDKDIAIAELDVWGGGESGVNAVSKTPIEIMVNKDNIVTNDDVKLLLHYQKPLIAPIAKNQEIGKLEVRHNDKVIHMVPLYAAQNIEKSSYIGRALKAPIGIFR